MQTKRILTAALAIALAFGTAAPISAHPDTNPDADPCDTTVRDGYMPGHEANDGANDVDLSPVAGTYIRNGAGQYVVRNDFGYVEVVGGQGYTYPGAPDPPTPAGNQGGYVQFELDVAGVPVDGDGHLATYADGHTVICLNAAENKVAAPTP